MSKFKHVYDLLRGETYDIKVIPFEKITEQVEGYPGLYSWYVRPKPNREQEITPILNELIQQTNLKATLEGNLRLSYSGTLTKSNLDIDSPSSDILRNAFLMAPYPLYIGMSINLKERLSVHFKQLNEANADSKLLYDDEDTKETPLLLDTKEESRFFAQRIVRVFKKAKIRSLDCLYLRVYEYRKEGETLNLSTESRRNITRQLCEVESIANTMFNPVFGRR